MNINEIARQLWKRGGEKTKKRGSAYFKAIGRKGLQKRWTKETVDKSAYQPINHGTLRDVR